MRYKNVFAALIGLVSMSLFGCQSGAPTAAPTASNTLASASSPTPSPQAAEPTNNEEFDGQKVERSPDEWRARLTPAQFHVLREEGTEKPYTGELLKNKEAGTYHCAACRLKLFKSEAKYESDTGWPSFFQPAVARNVTEKEDKTHGEARTEIECSRCGSHLGHVFDDGPKPTGLRYCMNSAALVFEPAKP